MIEIKLPGPGTLALAGSGEYLPAMQDVDRFLLQKLREPARVVTLATAAGTEGEDRLLYWNNLGEQHFSNLGVQSVQALPVVDRQSAEDQDLAEAIRKANFVYLSGGKPGYLFQTLAGSRVWAAILEILQSGGVVAGCSAGAMIFGEFFPGFRQPWKMQDGFGFIKNSYIVPHFDELPAALMTSLSLIHPQTQMIGIEGFTALVCSNRGCQVRGQGRVIFRKGSTFRQFRQEDPINL